MTVQIIDPDHAYTGLTGKLLSKRKVAGRLLFVYLDDYCMDTEVTKEQVRLI